jgi:hypothetical protein
MLRLRPVFLYAFAPPLPSHILTSSLSSLSPGVRVAPAAILLRPAAEIVRLGLAFCFAAHPVGNLALWLPRRDHWTMAHTPLTAWEVSRGDLHGLAPLIACPTCYRGQLSLFNDGTIQCRLCLSIITRISSDVLNDRSYSAPIASRRVAANRKLGAAARRAARS